MPWEPTVAGAGVTIVAALCVGGFVLLRYQRERNHFQLMKAAIDKGITAFPGATPGWLISQRIGALTMVLGIGLVIAGVLWQVHTGGPIVTGGGSSSPAAVSAPPPPQPAGSVQPAPPPPPSPELEHERRLEDQDLLGRAAICVGGILTLLGIVRIIFAGLERRYTSDAPPR